MALREEIAERSKEIVTEPSSRALTRDLREIRHSERSEES